PRGGVLVAASPDAALDATDLPAIQLDIRQLSDLELIANGALSPLDGFMGRADYERVVAEGRLASGLPWTIPVTLSARAEVADRLGPREAAAIRPPPSP